MSHACPFCNLPVEQSEVPVFAACPRCGEYFKVPAARIRKQERIYHRREMVVHLGIVLIMAASTWLVW